ncbi:MAG: hypothetical protein K9N35_12630 [Candidatus Marinimicrobia bacterium]|nr:hypothetical protein [Candidatus Neomarinimicrobiota bacterium]
MLIHQADPASKLDELNGTRGNSGFNIYGDQKFIHKNYSPIETMINDEIITKAFSWVSIGHKIMRDDLNKWY